MTPTHANCPACKLELLWWVGGFKLCWNPACKRWLKGVEGAAGYRA